MLRDPAASIITLAKPGSNPGPNEAEYQRILATIPDHAAAIESLQLKARAAFPQADFTVTANSCCRWWKAGDRGNYSFALSCRREDGANMLCSVGGGDTVQECIDKAEESIDRYVVDHAPGGCMHRPEGGWR